MRTSSLVTFSIPPAMVTQAERVARRQHMTRSELIRSALRRYLEELTVEETVLAYKKERQEGKLKELTGSLASLMS